jgi:DDE superfamily endonuclease.
MVKSVPKAEKSYFVDLWAAHPQVTHYLKNLKYAFLPPNFTNILQTLYLGIITSFKHYHCKQLVRKIISRLITNCFMMQYT